MVAERAGAIAEHDLLVVLRDDVEVALDAALQVDQHRRHLRPVEPLQLQRGAVSRSIAVPIAPPTTLM